MAANKAKPQDLTEKLEELYRDFSGFHGDIKEGGKGNANWGVHKQQPGVGFGPYGTQLFNNY